MSKTEKLENAADDNSPSKSMKEKIEKHPVSEALLITAGLCFLGLVLFVCVGLIVGFFSRHSQPKQDEIQFEPNNRIIEEFVAYEKDYGRDWPFGYRKSVRVMCEVRDYGPAKNLPLVVVDLGGFWFGMNKEAFNEGGYNQVEASPPQIKHGTNARISYKGLEHMRNKALALPACAALAR